VGIITITDMLRKLTGWQPSSAALEVDLEEEVVERPRRRIVGTGCGWSLGRSLWRCTSNSNSVLCID
jgi:hypothetical protein